MGHCVSDLSEGALDSTLAYLYGQGAAAARSRYLALTDRYRRQFGGQPAGLFSAPGRTEIGGNHTDHQHGCVLAASVNLDISAAAAPNGEEVIRVCSEGFPDDVIRLDDISGPHPEETNRSAALIRGVAARMKALGYTPGGFNAVLSSRIPGGSGLSSSAAYEVLLAGIISHFFCGGSVEPVVLAKVGQYAENIYFGKPSGLMDQVASAVGGAVFVDLHCPENPAVEQIPVNWKETGCALCILDCGADHADLTSEYAAITDEMGAVASVFQKDVLGQVEEELFYRRLPSLRKTVGDRAVLRAMHYFSDSRRAAAQARALKQKDFNEFIKLVRESGRSSAFNLQNVTPSGRTFRQELALALALCEKYLDGRGAFRVHGGGFGGTAQAFVPLEMVPEFTRKMEAVFGQGSCHVLSFRPVGFVRLA